MTGEAPAQSVSSRGTLSRGTKFSGEGPGMEGEGGVLGRKCKVIISRASRLIFTVPTKRNK